MISGQTTPRFRDRDIVFANGAHGRTIDFETANPVNFHEAISHPARMSRAMIDGKLFLPPPTGESHQSGSLAVVIVVPGSLGVAASHLQHAETITGLGAAAFVIDPFGARGVSSTVANQAQYSFAASAYDVLAAVRALAALPEIDTTRIGAQGHSRGGSAVLSAAARRFADPVLAALPRLRAIYAAYPWSGQQFLDPDVGDTRVRAVIGDRDGWCSAQQVQGHIHAIRLRGGDATLRIFEDAAHSFDRETPIEHIAEASVAPGAPTIYIADDGAMIHPVTGAADPALQERDVMLYGFGAGYGVKGADIGSKGDQPAAFRADMAAFWRAAVTQ